MYEVDAAFLDRIGVDNADNRPKQGRHPVGNTMSDTEREQILAALAAANEETKLFPKK